MTLEVIPFLLVEFLSEEEYRITVQFFSSLLRNCGSNPLHTYFKPVLPGAHRITDKVSQAVCADGSENALFN